MNKNKLFLICMAVIMTIACCAVTASAESFKQWNGCCCASDCGINSYFTGTACGCYTGIYCTPNFVAPFQAEFIKDVSYADGAYVAPGTTFVKTWRLRNVGTQAWTTDMSLVFVSGDQMGAPASVKLPCYVAPGQKVDLSITMVAPASGSATGQWMLKAPDGTLFGVGCNGQTPIWATINTWYNGCYASSIEPCNSTACATGSNTGYRPGRNPYCNNRIRDVKDVTIPDGTHVAPGAAFRKTWSMKNDGTCYWDANYVLVQVAGDDLGGAEFVSVTAAKEPNLKYPVDRPATKIAPGEYITISIDLVAPTTPGTYEAYFRLRDGMGYEFGYGSYADSAFWVNIVVDPAAKSADPEGDSGVISKDVDPTEVPGAEGIEIEDATVVEDPNVNVCGEQSVTLRGTETGYDVTWTAVNAGTGDWENFKLVLAENEFATLADGPVVIPTTAAGATAEVTFSVTIDSAATGSVILDFYVDSGSGQFCQFSFEAPAK